MIKKIIKNRRKIAENVAMITTLYAVIVIHSVRLMYSAKNS
mgnify:CR=1 FL=1